ncbi:MAG: hypothetical protein WC827_00570 [Candidatus Paceibacterota bacterium]
MTDIEKIKIYEEGGLENSGVIETCKSYSGICDVYSPEEAKAMADELRKERKNSNRKVMIGVMTHPLTLNPERGRGIPECDGVREVFPSIEAVSGGFIDDPDVLNTVHYADLYGPNKGQDIFANLELVVKYGGENLHAIQIDVTWPNIEELKAFKVKHQQLAIILQVGRFALKEVDNDPQKVVERLREYGGSIDFVLLDTSMGKGVGIESEGLLPLLRLIKKELPGLGLAVAGGLGPDQHSMDELEPIAKEFPGISIDAQGRVKHADAPKDALGHMISTIPANLERSKEYIQKSCTMLDNPPKE